MEDQLISHIGMKPGLWMPDSKSYFVGDPWIRWCFWNWTRPMVYRLRFSIEPAISFVWTATRSWPGTWRSGSSETDVVNKYASSSFLCPLFCFPTARGRQPTFMNTSISRIISFSLLQAVVYPMEFDASFGGRILCLTQTRYGLGKILLSPVPGP